MLRNKRKGFASYNSNPNFIFDDDEEEKVNEINIKENNLLIPNDPCTSNLNINWYIEEKEEDEKEEKEEIKVLINKNKQEEEKIKNIIPENLFKKRDSKLRELAFINSLAAQQEILNKKEENNYCNNSITTTTHEDDELSQICENETLLEGEILLVN
jgi:hypothetical protein